jgi:hypothetical protein
VYVFVPEQTGSGPTTGPLGVTGSPLELTTDGGVGTTCASAIHGTVDPPAAGNVKVGGFIVYVYTHCCDEPVQSVYVHVYVFVPEQTGSGPTTGPDSVSGEPQELFTVGGLGTTCASSIQATVELPGAGSVKVGGLTVYVKTYCTVDPVQSVYVHVYVFVPEQTGSAPMTGPVMDSGAPQELLTTGGVGTTCASLIQGTVALPGAGAVAVGGDIVYVYTHCCAAPEQSV